jgi:GT2 family glycosyltransferase
MKRVLDDEPGEALVTPKIVLGSDPSRVNAIGNDVHLSYVAWCHGLGTPAVDWTGVTEVAAISGAAFMAHRGLLDRLGGLEEQFFMYMEDVDLSLRARNSGARCLVACDAVSSHGWSLALTPDKFRLLERNRRAVWNRFPVVTRGSRLVLAQAEAMAWAWATIRGPRFLKAKRQAHRDPLILDAQPIEAGTILPWLSRRHPYDVLFPGSRLVGRAGGLVDAMANRWAR